MDPSEGREDKHLFELFWAPLPDGVATLAGDLDQALPRLIRRLTDET